MELRALGPPPPPPPMELPPECLQSGAGPWCCAVRGLAKGYLRSMSSQISWAPRIPSRISALNWAQAWSRKASWRSWNFGCSLERWLRSEQGEVVLPGELCIVLYPGEGSKEQKEGASTSWLSVASQAPCLSACYLENRLRSQ